MHEACVQKARSSGHSGACPRCGQWCREVASAQSLRDRGAELLQHRDFAEGAGLITDSLELEDSNTYALGVLGVLFFKGLGVEQDFQKAGELLVKAYEIGGITKQTAFLGPMYAEGLGVEKDLDKCIEIQVKAGRSGEATTVFETAQNFLGSDDPFLVQIAVRTFERLYDSDCCGYRHLAASWLGYYFIKQASKSAQAKGVRLLQEAHDAGCSFASFWLAVHYKRSDPEKAYYHWDFVFTDYLSLGGVCDTAAVYLGRLFLRQHQLENGVQVGIALLLLAHDAGNKLCTLDRIQTLFDVCEGKRSLHYVLYQCVIETAKKSRQQLEAFFGGRHGWSPLTLARLSKEETIQRYCVGNPWVMSRVTTEVNGSKSLEALSFAFAAAAAGGSAGSSGTPGTPASTSELILLEFSRHPRELAAALLKHPALKRCGRALESQGLAVEQPSGGKLFVRPSQHAAALKAVGTDALLPWHVLVAPEFEAAVLEAVRTLPSKAQVRTKQRSGVAVRAPRCGHCEARDPKYRCSHCGEVWYCSKACQKKDWPLHKQPTPVVVRRTFLTIDLPSSLRTEPSSGAKTASTSEANERVAFLPRRA